MFFKIIYAKQGLKIRCFLLLASCRLLLALFNRGEANSKKQAAKSIL